MRLRFLITAVLLFTITASFAQKYDMSLIPYRNGEKWGYSSADKNIVISAKYDEAQWFSEGYAAVKMGNKWGYINNAGKLVIPAKFNVAKPFSKGYIPTKMNSGSDTILFAGASLTADMVEVCIDKTGKTLNGCPAKTEENEPEIAVTTQKKVYSVANDGFYDEIVNDFIVNGEQYYIAKKNGLYGVFNTKFDMSLPFEYTAITATNTENSYFLLATKNGMSGLFDYSGKELLPMQARSLQLINGPMNKGYVIVKDAGRAYINAIDGKAIMNRSYNDVSYDDQGGFILVGDGNLKGFYFTDNTYISPKYTEVKLMPGGKYLRVKTFAGKEGYINNEGVEFFN